MSDVDCRERLAVLETSQKEIINDLILHVKKEESYMEAQGALLREIREEQAKMKSFWSGMVFTVTAFGAGAVMAINYFTK